MNGGAEAVAWAECIPPRNFSDARAAFRCSALNQNLSGAACARNWRVGAKMRTVCTGCPAGAARAAFMPGAEMEGKRDPVRLVPIDAPAVVAVHPLEIENANLRAEVERLRAELSERPPLLRREPVKRQKKYKSEIYSERMREVGRIVHISLAPAGDGVQAIKAWCVAHGVGVAQLARRVLAEVAAAEGVALRLSFEKRSGPVVGLGTKNNYVFTVPQSWVPWLDEKRRYGSVSPMAREGMLRYVAEHP